MLRCGTNKNDEVVQVTDTSPTFPPIQLIRYARHQKLLPTTEFPTIEVFRNSLYELLTNLHDDIEHLGTFNPFWDQSYDGRKKEKPSPKRETDIHPTLHLLFSEWSLMHSVEVIPENITGAGVLDFCFVGFVSGIGQVSICVEVKKAHADDIIHGFDVQLPMYMQRKKAQYGAYVVLWFKGEWFDKPTLADIQRIRRTWISDHDESPIEPNFDSFEFAITGKTLADSNLLNIRVYVIDVSKPIMASKA